MKKIFFIFLILLFSRSYVTLAGDIQVAGSVDKAQVQIDEEISFTIRILGARGNLQAPRLPPFEGFDSFYTGRTSHFTFVNGKSSATVEFNYVLVPKVAGRFTLDAVEVWIEGKRFQTHPLEIEVFGPRTQPTLPVTRTQPSAPAAATIPTQAGPTPALASAPGAAPSLLPDENIFVKAWVDKQTVYPNEQILLTYTLHTRYDTRYEGFEEEPTVSGFWIEDFPLDRDLGRETVSVGGKRFVKADIRKLALFPTAPATYTIQPGVLKVSIREEPRTTSIFDEFFSDSFFTGASFFARRVERLLKPEPLTITVKPFPETGKPASFIGAVGQFRLSASLDRKEVKQNEPVTLTVVLEGEGNIETLARPQVPLLSGFKVYDGDSSTQLFKVGSTIAGKKTFEVIFIPTVAGELAIPPLEFSFFDPRRETYQVLRTQTFPLRVQPSAEPLRLPAELAEKEVFKKEIRREAEDIRYIHEELPSGRLARAERFLFRLLVGANLLALSLVATGLFRRRREALFSRDVALRRRKLARQAAARRLKELKRLLRAEKPGEVEQFAEALEKILSEYLCNKFNLSPYQFTLEGLEERLAQAWGPEEPLLRQIREFYEVARETRFGRGMLLSEERREFFELVEKVIERVEKLPERYFIETSP